MKRNVELYQNPSDRLKLEGETENMGLMLLQTENIFF